MGVSMQRVVVFVVASAWVAGCRADCELNPVLRGAAGPGAVACGRAPLSGDQAAAHRCAVEALRAGRAFWVEWQVQGIDSEVWMGVAGAAGGGGYQYLWDGDPSGGGRVGARIQGTRCGRFEVADVRGRQEVSCREGASLGTVCEP